jgi:hypothetical protein
MDNNKKWKELGAKEQTNLIVGVAFCFASIILGFVSFIILQEIPGSVIGTSSMFGAYGCGLLGLGIYIKNQMGEINTQMKEKLDELDKEIDKSRKFREETE